MAAKIICLGLSIFMLSLSTFASAQQSANTCAAIDPPLGTPAPDSGLRWRANLLYRTGDTQVIEGRVTIELNRNILCADQIKIMDSQNAIASGWVMLLEPNGTVINAERLHLPSEWAKALRAAIPAN